MGLDPAAGAEDPLISQAHGRKLSPVWTTRIQQVDADGSGLFIVRRGTVADGISWIWITLLAQDTKP